MNRRLEGKVVLISGTGGGQGRAAALRFAADGAIIVGCDVSGAADAETAGLVTEAGGIMTTMVCDLGDPAEAQAWVDRAVSDHGRVDVVYNNASAAKFGSIADLSIDDWRFTIRNELDLVFLTTKFAWPHLAKRGSDHQCRLDRGLARLTRERHDRPQRDQGRRDRHDATDGA